MADTKNDSAAPKAAAPATPRADAPSAAPRAMEKAADAAPKAAEKAAPAPMKEAAKAAAEIAVAPVRAAAATVKAAETAARKPARRTARRTAKATPARASTARRAKTPAKAAARTTRAKTARTPAKAAPARAAAKPAPRARAQAAKAAPAAARTIKTNTINSINAKLNEGNRTMKNEAKQAADRIQAVFGDVNERARTAMERNTRIAEEMTELTKGNVEALVASTKVAAKGVETLGQEVAEFNRKSFEDVSAALKSFAEVKSPTDFLRLQTEFARSQFDTVVAETSKLSETMIKLAGDVAQPINSRYSVASERVRSAVAF